MALEILFENKTTDGDSNIIAINDGGFRNIKVTGTFGTAIITLYADFNDNDYAPLTEDNLAQTITTPGFLNLQPFKAATRFKATISGVTTGTDLTAKLL